VKTIKPDKLGLLLRTFEHDGRPYMVVSALLAFAFDKPRELVSEIDLWKMTAEELEAEGGLVDEACSKHTGEVLVTGKCHVPDGAPVPVSFVRVQIGKVDKRLAVIGDRQWRYGVPTEPAPFTEMPVDWQHAFGGEGYAQNPRGKGVAPVEAAGVKSHPLPNIEDPRGLVVGPSDKPLPAGLGAIDLTWPQRFSLTGTYDTKWLKTRYPGYAADLDPSFFNMAAKDQRIEGYFRGDEAFVIENMHPEKSRLEGALPNAVVRVFWQPKGEDGLREITTRIDTVRFFPGREIGVLIYRGVAPVREDDAADVGSLILACEDPEEKKPLDHYRKVLTDRQDPEKAALLSLKDDDLMPSKERGWTPRTMKSDVDRMIENEGLLSENLRRKQEKERDAARAKVVAAGLDPKDFGLDEPLPEPPSDPDDVDAELERIDRAKEDAEKEREAMEAKQAELEAQVRAAYTAAGEDYDAAVAKAKKDAAGPPKYRAQEQLDMLRSMVALARENKSPNPELAAMAEDPALEAKLLAQEKSLIDAYRQGAHLQDPVDPREPGASDALRTELGLAVHNGIGLTGRDLTGADLSGLSLAGLDLSGAFMESVDLTGTDLSGANLENAVLAHATLRGTKLVGAKLTGVNLGSAKLDGADFGGAEIAEVVLGRADIQRTSFRGAKMRRVDFLEAKLGEGVDFGEVLAHESIWLRVSLAKAIFAGADLTRSVFIEANVAGADFQGATLTRVGFVKTDVTGAIFRGAKMDGAQFVHGTSLAGADLSGVEMKQAMLREVDLTGATLEGAVLDASDLSACNATDADLTGIRARGALFIRSDLTRAKASSADLLGAILQKAKLHGTDLRYSNLFRADLARVRVDGSTRIDQANMTQARSEPKATDEPR
jgi:uncharacterized protein YjbI with pentapeptide repeats